MKTLIKVCALFILLGGFPSITLTQDVTIDFGDSGIVVVVTPSEPGFDTGWSYWFPDEFENYISLLPKLPPVSFPGWAGGGGGGSASPECRAAQAILDNLYDQLQQITEQWVPALEKQAPLARDGNIYEANTPGWNNTLYYLISERDRIKNEIENAHKEKDVACNNEVGLFLKGLDWQT